MSHNKAQSTNFGSDDLQIVKQITVASSHPGSLGVRVVALFMCKIKVTAPQDAHERLVLQVYLGSNTLEFSGIRRENLR